VTTPEEPGALEGAGVLSSYADLADALGAEHVDPTQVAFTAAGAGLDTLGFVANPLDSLLTAGIGWLIEHVDFLSEPLDAVAGDPNEIREQAAAWHLVSTELAAVATELRRVSDDVVAGGWDGAAAEQYALATERCSTALDRAGADAAELSGLVLSTGAAVGTVRALIRDTLAGFVAKVIQWVLAALAASVATAGFSLAALIAAVVEQAVSVARSCVRRISALLELLDEAGTNAARLGAAVRDTAAELGRAVRNTTGDPAVVATSRRMEEVVHDAVARAVPDGLERGLDRVTDAAERAKVPVLVEAGKQATGEQQKLREGA
jgi:hypothetical protein